MPWINGNKRTIITVSLILFLGLTIGVIWKSASSAEKTAVDIPLVRAQVVHTGKGSSSYQYSGEVRSHYESNLAFMVSGKIVSRNVEVGSIVKAGDPLMQIDPSDAAQTLETISAQLAGAESQYKLAQDSFKRCKQLYDAGAVSKADLDKAQNACDSAQAAVRQINAQYALCQNQLQYTTLRADRDGVVTGVYAEVGQVVIAMAAAPTVVTLAQNNDLEVEINIPENRIATLSKAQNYKISFWALPALVLDGQVREIAPMADPVAKTFRVRIAILNPPPEVKLGMTSSVNIEGMEETQTAAVIPITAIYQTGDSPAVWTVANDAVTLRTVKIESFDKEQVKIVDGLHDGDLVVTAGVHKLMEGQRVRPEISNS